MASQKINKKKKEKEKNEYITDTTNIFKFAKL